MPKSFMEIFRTIKSSFEDDFEGSLERTQLYFEIFGNYEKEEYIANSSRSLNFGRIEFSAILCAAFYLLVKFILKQDYVENDEISIKIEVLMLGLFMLSIIGPIYYLIRNAQLLKVDKKGIQILNDMIPWSDIYGTYIECRTSGESNHDYYLLVKAKKRNY